MSSMEQYRGKDCKIRISSKGIELFYSAYVTEVSDSHISFIDKYGEHYTFSKEQILEITTRQRDRRGTG